MAIYDLGTASLAANGEVTGVGTTWKAPLTLIRVGATIVFKTEPVQIYTISEIISDTRINVYNPNSETVPAGTGYAILAHDGITVQGLAQDVAETLRYYQSRETEVADAVDAFNNFDANDFSAKVSQVNTQHGDVVTIGTQVANDAAQVSADKYAAAASAESSNNSALRAENAANSVSSAIIISFEAGGVIESPSQQCIHINNGEPQSYIWNGEFPKTVQPGSTPSSSGGISQSAWSRISDYAYQSNLRYGDMTDVIGYKGYASLTSFLRQNIRTVEEFREGGMTDDQVFQAAINAGSIRMLSGQSISITNEAEITIPANRLIVIDSGAYLESNGRFSAYGVQNVHWVINGTVKCSGMSDAPAKSGWPNTAEGTQNGNERGFIEFGGINFAGDDGGDYSVTGSGSVVGYWSGTPNTDDIPTQVNRKGIAAWNCSRFYVSNIKISGFEGEQVYWFSRNPYNRDCVFSEVKSTMARFNALNINAYSATEGIVVRDCYVNVAYNGIETSSGNLINCTFDNTVGSGVLFGLGSGGSNRDISGNNVNNCSGTAYSLLYNKDYEGRGYVQNVKISNNKATNPGLNFITASGMKNCLITGNQCTGLLSGRFIQATFMDGCLISENVNQDPAPGTSHVYIGECYSTRDENNVVLNSGLGLVSAAASTHSVFGGLKGESLNPGSRENFFDLRTNSPSIGSGGEYRFSYDIGSAFTPATISSNLRSYDVTGAMADICLNNLKINGSDALGTSWKSVAEGHWLPGIDAFSNIGSASLRIGNIYLSTAPVVTSNEKLKTELLTISERERSAAIEIKNSISKYKMIDSVEKKGFDGARWHFGVGAQTVGEILKKHGLDPSEYGFWCKDYWGDEYEDQNIRSSDSLDMEFNGSVKVSNEGENYGIRYDELMMFILASI